MAAHVRGNNRGIPTGMGIKRACDDPRCVNLGPDPETGAKPGGFRNELGNGKSVWVNPSNMAATESEMQALGLRGSFVFEP